ncbi:MULTISPECIES: LLM class flavin-dependent oxidoreductase [unclassified Paenibacillus]|uniref:LLM class flavin-dependent oxidoreductase n=1 Tax=unclassified Paenibacillus TaxID=185978 RepID=UPI001AE58920|nr:MULTISPECIES: LLM class flavin-dependent oxidoreductase [unclassified Paenibacillus]MBP1156714.1 luciferase family oxidoreductase group 1 [Paenibacillus sp. PvP091]MBP1172548.1 luciferase family oxidoreductase group 1 [Paenibacillus sp. PvR098]MBP2438928.1 luciferase family oxidoreductase group 1 [Paenibacillus sp. PvP052]
MKLSVLDLVPVLEGADSVQALEQAVLLARTAEKLGYHRYWVAEHHDMQGLACTSPEVLLAHIGAHTQRIRLGSGAVLLPHYKPIKVAETYHMLSSLYPGRIDLGIGRAPGGSAHVSMALSGNFLENVRVLPETIQALSHLLANSYQLEGQPVKARPIPPHPPEVWMLGTNHKSASYAAEFGTGYVFGQFMSDKDGMEVLAAYRQEFRPSHLSDEPHAIVAVGIVCADTEEEAKSLAIKAKAWFRPEDPAEEEGPDSERKLLVGTPEQVKAKLEELRSMYGVDEFVVVTMVPDYQKRLRSYELLARIVTI